MIRRAFDIPSGNDIGCPGDVIVYDHRIASVELAPHLIDPLLQR